MLIVDRFNLVAFANVSRTVCHLFASVFMTYVLTLCGVNVNVIYPELTLCGWQGVDIQELADLSQASACLNLSMRDLCSCYLRDKVSK